MDKNKIIEAATKFVQQGKYDKAIKEYEKVLAADPKDARIQQKLGEIYQKKGENDQAANYFLKVAESYSGDGFALRAVAVYKQVLKLDDKRIDVNLKLAELYQQLGLMSDAMSQLQLVSAHYEKTGNATSSLEILKRMVELDSDNVSSRIKLAELYARDSLNAEAVSEFQKAATYLKRNSRIDDYVKVAERLVFLDPNDVGLSRELAQIYLTKQDTKRALAKLQICFKADPRDVDTLTLLAQAFHDLGQTSKTVSVYKELAKIYDEQGRVDDERGIWERVLQIAPEDVDAARRLQPAVSDIEPEMEPEPEPIPQPVAKRGTNTFKRIEEASDTLTPEQIAKLLTETDVYVKYGLHDKAVEHLKKIFAVDPENVDAHDKEYQIAVNAGEKSAVTEDKLIKVIRLAAAHGDMARAQARLQTLLETNPGHEMVPEFLQSIGTAPLEEAHEIVDDSILIDSVDDAQVVEDEPAVEAAASDSEMLVDGGDEVFASAEEIQSADIEPMLDDEPLGDLALSAHESLVADDAAISLGDESFGAVDEPLMPDAEAFGAAEDEPLALGDEALEAAADEPLFPAGTDDLATVHGDVSVDELLLSEPEAEHAIDSGDIVAEPEFAELGAESDAGAVDGEPAFAEARSEAALDEIDEPPTGEQALHAVNSNETDFSSLDEIDSPPDRRFEEPEPEPEREPEGVTRVVNLADLARMREEIAAKSAQKSGSGSAANSSGSLRAAPPETEAPGAPAPRVEDMVTFARVPVARPVSRSQSAARPPSKGQQPAAAKVPTGATMAAAPRPDLMKAAQPPPEELEAQPAFDEVAPDGDPASEELEEASFFIEQGVFEEAREILETVQLAYPGNQRALDLLAQLEAKEKGATAPPASDEDSGGDSSFDLAQELADELGDVPTGQEAAAPLSGGDDAFQIAAADVFAEFKKGVSKVIKPEDVDTHYDLGIAYKEMGLFNDAIEEFEQAMKGAIGKPREVDCHLMIAACKQLLSDAPGAITSFSSALNLPQTVPEQAKALHFEIAATYEGMGQMGKALSHYMMVAAIDPSFRDADQQVSRLQGDGAEPDPDEPPAVVPAHINGVKKGGAGDGGPSQAAAAPAEPSANKPASRKIGYV